MMRFIGAVFVIFSTGYFGFEYGRNIQRRISELNTLKRIFTDLYSDVEYGACTLAESFERIAKNQDPLYKKLLTEVCLKMKCAKGLSFGDILGETSELILKESALHVDDKRQLMDLGKQLGNNPRQGQLRILQLYLQDLEHTIEELEKTKQDKQKLSRILGLTSGVLIVILLL